MKKLALWTVGIGLVLGFAGLTIAADDANKGTAAGKGDGVAHMLKKFDKNGDGALDAGELTALLDARQKQRAESGKSAKGGKGAEHLTADVLIKKFDKNGDGKLDASELQEMDKELHARHEAKKDAAAGDKK